MPVRLTIVGNDLARIMEIGIAAGSFCNAHLIHTADPMSAARDTVNDSDCTILTITPRDSIIDLRRLISAARLSSLLFLADTLPLCHTAARLIRTSGHAVLAASEPTVVVAATVIALRARAKVTP